MDVLKLDRLAEIKSVRVNIDHIEKIIAWISIKGMNCTYFTQGISKEFEQFNTLENLIVSKGVKPKSIVIDCVGDGKRLQIFINVQYCIIEGYNIEPDLSKRVTDLLRSTVPKIFRLFPFKWFTLLCIVMFFIGVIGFFATSTGYWFLINFTLYPLLAFILVGIYNNFVVGISLVRIHEKTSFLQRKKDDIILLLIGIIILTPIANLIWEMFLKALFESYFN